MLYQMTATDSEGEERHFEKPLFLTFVMFVAMACALPIYYVQQVGVMCLFRVSPFMCGESLKQGR